MAYGEISAENGNGGEGEMWAIIENGVWRNNQWRHHQRNNENGMA
jgi:hypothetical protein